MKCESDNRSFMELSFSTPAVVIALFCLMRPTALAQSTSSLSTLDCVYMIRIPENRQHRAAIQTGFRLRGTRGIVTALHGVVDGNVFSAINEKNEVFTSLSIGSVDIDSDLAVLVSNDPRLQSGDGLPMSQQYIGSGAILRVLGHPLGINLHLKTVQTGNPALVRLSRLIPPAAADAFERRRSPSSNAQVLDIEAPLVPGDSGAPVLDGAGAVLGVVDGGLLQGQAAISWAITLGSVQFRTVASLRAQIAALARFPSEDLFSFESDTTTVTTESETFLWDLKDPNAKPGKLKGIVRGPDGQPLAGVKVEARRYEDRTNPFGHYLASVLSNAQGEYEIAVPAGGYHFVIHKDGYETISMFYVAVAPGVLLDPGEMTLKLESGARLFTELRLTDPGDPMTSDIQGKVTDYSGNVIAGAFVTVTDSNDSLGSWHGRTVKTDSNGNFRVVNLRADLYDVTFEARGLRTMCVLGVPTKSGHALNLENPMSVLRNH